MQSNDFSRNIHEVANQNEVRYQDDAL